MLKKIRTAEKFNRKREIIYCVLWIVAGLLVGVYSEFAIRAWTDGSFFRAVLAWTGDMFGGFTPWIFLGTVIAVYSQRAYTAAITVPLFCFAMLLSHYIYSAFVSEYLRIYIVIAWCVVALLSSVAGYFAWFSKNDSRKKTGTPRKLGLLMSSAPIAFLITTMIPTYRMWSEPAAFAGVPFAIALFFMLQKGGKERLIVAGISVVVGAIFGIIPVIEFVFGAIL